MLIGQPYRKLISQTGAYIAYRAIAVWLLVALCASFGQMGLVVSLGVVAITISVAGTGTGLHLLIVRQSRQDWQDRLTNRIFYELFWEALKSEDRVDIDQLFKEAGEKATADIKSAASRDEFGFLDKTTWHWFGGALHFLGLLFWDLVYYGSAIWVGTVFRSPF
jgi:hypothetical protein